MSESRTVPRCYVLGLETQIGLSIVRELGRAGIPVIGIATSPDAIGLRCRYLQYGEIAHGIRSDQGIAELRAIGERHGPGYLLAISEANMSWLIDCREQLGAVTPLVPTRVAFDIVADKARTLEAAQAVGIDVPIRAVAENWEDVERLAASFPFPAVLKWAAPNEIASELQVRGIELLKAEYVYTADQFVSIAERYRPVGTWPMIQEYCPGVGLGQSFFMHRGEPVRRFQHIRVAEWPPEGGFSSVCDAVPTEHFAALQEKSVQLLRNIGWDGLAMVEYRYDPATKRSVLMEINGRFWGSYPLATQCNAGFAVLAYYLQGMGRMPDLPPLRQHLRCRMVATELKRLWRILVEREKIMDRAFRVRPFYEIGRFLSDFLRPSVGYYVWSLSDPKPFFRDIRNAVGI